MKSSCTDYFCSNRLARLLAGLLVAICLLPGVGYGAAGTDAPLTFGIFPYRAPQWLATAMAPLRDYLQQAGGRPVNLISAPSMQKYRERTLAGDYDILFTPPHIGRLAERERQFQYIAVTGFRIYGVIVVPKESPVRQLVDLRGKRVAFPPSTAITYMLALDLLRSQGLEVGRDIALRVYETNQNSLAAPLRGDADAALTGILLWRKEGNHEKLRVLAETASVPGFTLMAHPRLPQAMVARLRKITEEFADTPSGKAYFATTAHVSWQPVDVAEMRRLDPMVRRISE